jgi:hypothetical protein
MKISSVRVPYVRLIVVALATVTAGVLLWVTRGYLFYYDEWDFIQSAPDWSWISFLQPHNEHPVMLPRLIYAALLSTIGMHSYVPYMFVLLALHAISAVALFELVRRRAGEAIALACAAMFLVLGAGWENLLWAFQIAFVGAVACGLGMLLALEYPSSPRRLLAAVALLTASLMFSGIGVSFGVAAAVTLVLTPARRRELLWFAPVVIAFGAWYLAFGHNGTGSIPAHSAANILLVPLYAVWGLGQSAAGLIGLGGPWGPPALLAAGAVVAATWWRRRPDPLALGVLAALLSLYVVTGMTRAQIGYQQSGAGRYIYEGAVFWLILLAGAARSLPWRGTWRPALVACLFLACFNSCVLLFVWTAAKTALMQRETADLQALVAERSDPCLKPAGWVDVVVMPQIDVPALYYRAIDRYGDPAAGRPITDRSDFDIARGNLTRSNCTPT